MVKTREGGTDQEVADREERVRSLVKQVQCDITVDPPIESGYEGPYDIVVCFLVLEVSCASIEEYRERMVRLSSLVKPGGTLLLLSTVREAIAGTIATYQVGSETFSDLGLSVNIITEALENARFEITTISNIREVSYKSFGLIFLCAEKR